MEVPSVDDLITVVQFELTKEQKTLYRRILERNNIQNSMQNLYYAPFDCP